MRRFALLAAALSSVLLTVDAQGYGYGGSPGGYASAPAGLPGAPTNCSVSVYLTKPWPIYTDEAQFATVLNVFVTNYESYTTNTPWTFEIYNPAYKTVEQGPWNWDDITVNNGIVSGQARQDWQALSPGRTANLGAIIGANAGQVESYFPQRATVNGSPCPVTTST